MKSQKGRGRVLASVKGGRGKRKVFLTPTIWGASFQTESPGEGISLSSGRGKGEKTTQLEKEKKKKEPHFKKKWARASPYSHRKREKGKK